MAKAAKISAKKTKARLGRPPKKRGPGRPRKAKRGRIQRRPGASSRQHEALRLVEVFKKVARGLVEGGLPKEVAAYAAAEMLGIMTALEGGGH